MKKVISILLVGLVLLGTFVMCNQESYAVSLKKVKEYTKSDVKLFVNETKIQDESFIVGNGKAYAPVRLVAELLNLKVDWNAKDREITISKNKEDREMIVPQQEKLILKDVFWSDVKLFVEQDGDLKQINSKVILVNNSSYLPLRDLSEALGVEVEWDGLKREINLKKYMYIGTEFSTTNKKITVKEYEKNEKVLIKISKNSYQEIFPVYAMKNIHGKTKLLVKFETKTYNFNIHVYGEDKYGENVLIEHSFPYAPSGFTEKEVNVKGYTKVYIKVYPTNDKASKIHLKLYAY